MVKTAAKGALILGPFIGLAIYYPKALFILGCVFVFFVVSLGIGTLLELLKLELLK